MKKIGVTINYYKKMPSSSRNNPIIPTTELGIIMLKTSPEIGSIVLVDGSPKKDEIIEQSCKEMDVNYIHTGKELTIPEAYNIGWRSMKEPYQALMANDILPHDPSTITKLYDYIKIDDIGCVFPYISHGDWKVQDPRFIERFEITCEPSFILLNFICFKRDVLERIGGVDEGYKVGFYDPILLIKVRETGYRAVLVGDTHMTHLNALTKKTGESSLLVGDFHTDVTKFINEYSELHYLPKGEITGLDEVWPYKFWKWPLSTTFSIQICWWISKHIPFKFFLLVHLDVSYACLQLVPLYNQSLGL